MEEHTYDARLPNINKNVVSNNIYRDTNKLARPRKPCLPLSARGLSFAFWIFLVKAKGMVWVQDKSTGMGTR